MSQQHRGAYTFEQKAWKAIRAAKRFTLNDLRMYTDCSQRKALNYLKILVDAGLLRELGVAGQNPGEGWYQLMKDPGPVTVTREILEGLHPANQRKGNTPGQPLNDLSSAPLKFTGSPRSNILDTVSAYVQANKTFELREAVNACDLPRKKVKRVLDKMCVEGRLMIIEEECEPRTRPQPGPRLKNPTYESVGHLNVRYNRKKSKRTLRDIVWSSVRQMGEFTRPELADFSGCPQKSVDGYVLLLEHHGYLAVTGKKSRAKRYRLVVDPGRERPQTPEFNKTGKSGRRT